MASRKPRRKADGSVELPEIRCPRCGTVNLGRNPTKGSWYCWKCGKGGPLPEYAGMVPAVSSPGEPEVAAVLSSLPDYARKMVEARGLDPLWLERRYGVRWDGERLHWPCGAGSSKRAIWPWDEPKTLTVPPRGLIGQHLLHKGARVVVTEGDYKAASIPLPWVGVGILGDAISDDQAQVIQASEPSEVIVMLDGGMDRQARKVAESLCLLPIRVVDSLPKGLGPDDIPRGNLYALLGGWK